MSTKLQWGMDPARVVVLKSIGARLVGRHLLRAAVSYGDELHLDVYRPEMGEREFIIATRALGWELIDVDGTRVVSGEDPKDIWVERLMAELQGRPLTGARIIQSLGLELVFGAPVFGIHPLLGQDNIARWEVTYPGDQELVVGPGYTWSFGPAA